MFVLIFKKKIYLLYVLRKENLYFWKGEKINYHEQK